MALPRFLVQRLPSSGRVELDTLESQHASQVLRLKPEDELVLFDGNGGEALARIHSLSKRSVLAEIVERTDVCRELEFGLDLVVALPKGDRQKVLIDGLVQAGVTRLIPLESARGVAQPTVKALERLRRVVIESSKQCGRNQLMSIESPMSLKDVAGDTSDSAVLRLFAHPSGGAGAIGEAVLRRGNWSAQEGQHSERRSSVQVVVGPEGGLTGIEAQLLREAGWQRISLGPRILRVETAAVCLAAYCAWNLP